MSQWNVHELIKGDAALAFINAVAGQGSGELSGVVAEKIRRRRGRGKALAHVKKGRNDSKNDLGLLKTGLTLLDPCDTQCWQDRHRDDQIAREWPRNGLARIFNLHI